MHRNPHDEAVTAPRDCSRIALHTPIALSTQAGSPMSESIIPNYSGDEALREPIAKALRRVVDPELSLSIVDVGLIYGLTVTPDQVHVLMTMTSAACPVTDMLVDEVYAELEQLFPMEVAINVELVWEPAWTPERMSPRARTLMNW